MPRYLIERSFPEGLGLSASPEGAAACREVIELNTERGVTWIHSYVSADDHKTFCIYDAPTPEAIRKAAAKNKLPVDLITQVRVLDPYFAI
jgi:predicted amidohydrolase YtcJ